MELFFALWAYESRGEDNRRAARICNAITNASLNHARLTGDKKVSDQLYTKEDDFMPSFSKQKKTVRQQSWKEMRQILCAAARINQ